MNQKGYLLLVLFLLSSLDVTSFETRGHVRFKDGNLHVYPQNDLPKYYLLSYRSSGSHYLMYMIQFLTKEVWHAPHKDYYFHDNLNSDKPPRYFRGHECNDKYIYNEHHGYHFKYQKQKDYIILLTRNYKECCFQNGILNTFENSLFEEISYRAKAYFSLVELFERWNPSNRIHIFYEDLICDPKSVLQRLSKFLKTNPNLNEEFLRNIDQHRANSFLSAKALNNNPQPSQAALYFHRQHYSDILLKKIDEIFLFTNPKLYTKYALERYCREGNN